MRKNILITGATSGIGLELAKQYSVTDNVIACGRNKSVLDELSESHSVETKAFDITNTDEIKHSTSDIDTLDIVVLNAGNCEYVDDPNQFDGALFERVIRVNLISIGYCLEYLLPKIKPGGQLVIVSSSSAFLPLPRAEAYGASKAAVTYLARTMATHIKDVDITVVHPGFVETPLTDKNDFPMPFRVNVDKAAKEIIQGVEKRKKDIHFPKRFTFLLKFFGSLPFSLWLPIAKGISR